MNEQRKDRTMNNVCEQCANPTLKGIHTCNAENPYHGQFSGRPGGIIELNNLSLLRMLLELQSGERDRVLRAVGL